MSEELIQGSSPSWWPSGSPALAKHSEFKASFGSGGGPAVGAAADPRIDSALLDLDIVESELAEALEDDEVERLPRNACKTAVGSDYQLHYDVRA